jgi:hypothetical protein
MLALGGPSILAPGHHVGDFGPRVRGDDAERRRRHVYTLPEAQVLRRTIPGALRLPGLRQSLINPLLFREGQRAAPGATPAPPRMRKGGSAFTSLKQPPERGVGRAPALP